METWTVSIMVISLSRSIMLHLPSTDQLSWVISSVHGSYSPQPVAPSSYSFHWSQRISIGPSWTLVMTLLKWQLQAVKYCTTLKMARTLTKLTELLPNWQVIHSLLGNRMYSYDQVLIIYCNTYAYKGWVLNQGYFELSSFGKLCGYYLVTVRPDNPSGPLCAELRGKRVAYFT